MSENGAYHCEVVGSLLRPSYLKEAMERQDIDARELTEVQDRGARDAIALQEACGVDVLTDGEVRRRHWFDSLTQALSGYGVAAAAPARAVFQTPGQGPSSDAPKLPAVVDKLTIRENLALREYQFLAQHTDRPVKVTLPGMTYASVLWVPGVSEEAYPDRAEYLADARRLMKEMVGEVVEAGCRYLQFDSPRYTALVSEEGQASLERLGLDAHEWLNQMIALDNDIMEAFPEVTFGAHLCRGNHRSMWALEGGYDAIAEQVFNDLGCQRLLVEYDSPRAGTFEPLRFVPDDKVVVLGLITTKQPELEDEDQLKHRIEEASRFVPLERLALSPQCGFASTLPGNLVTPDDQKAKLELLARVCDAVWN